MLLSAAGRLEALSVRFSGEILLAETRDPIVSVVDPSDESVLDDTYCSVTAGTEPLAQLPEALAAYVTETTRVLLGIATTHRGASDTDDQTVREGDDG